MGKSGEGKNTAHQTKKLDDEDDHARSATASTSRSRTTSWPSIPFYKPADDTPEMKYLHERRKALGGYLPQRRAQGRRAAARCRRSTPSRPCSKPTAEGREISTTQAFVRFLTHAAARQGARPARRCRSWSTRRAPSAWRACSARSASTTREGQKYTPVDTRPGHVLPRGQGRPDPAGRHQRGGRHVAAGSPRRRRTRRTTASWCRSTSTTRCSASSASATWPGRRATCRRAASCSAAPRGARR